MNVHDWVLLGVEGVAQTRRTGRALRPDKLFCGWAS